MVSHQNHIIYSYLRFSFQIKVNFISFHHHHHRGFEFCKTCTIHMTMTNHVHIPRLFHFAMVWHVKILKMNSHYLYFNHMYLLVVFKLVASGYFFRGKRCRLMYYSSLEFPNGNVSVCAFHWQIQNLYISFQFSKAPAFITLSWGYMYIHWWD